MWSKDLLESRNVILSVNLFIMLQYKLFLSQSLMEFAKQILYMSDLGKIKEKGLYFSNSQQCVLEIATSSTSPGNLLEMQILLQCRPTESENLSRVQWSVLKSPPGDSDAS